MSSSSPSSPLLPPPPSSSTTTSATAIVTPDNTVQASGEDGNVDSTTLQSKESNNTIKKEEEEPRDEEGLLLQYDVILCGTGLVQSILASALARAGKKVLHCDGAENYGELEAVWTLPGVREMLATTTTGKPSVSSSCDTTACTTTGKEELDPDTTGHSVTTSMALSKNGALRSFQVHSVGETTSFPFVEIGSIVQTPVGQGVVKAIPSKENAGLQSLAVEFNHWKMANGTCPVAYFGMSQPVAACTTETQSLEDYFTTHHKIQSIRSIQAQKILTDPWSLRSLVFDVTPSLVFASGLAVEGMLSSGVAQYVDFKPLEALLWLEDDSNNNNNNNNNKDSKSHKEPLSRVPCSKGDVFGTKLLAPMDKRRLMKFMQLSMDYATSLAAQSQQQQQSKDVTNSSISPTTPEDSNNAPSTANEDEVQSLNERHLNQGRSLARPQNKAVSTTELQDLHDCIANGTFTFDTYLTKTHKLSNRLKSLVRYALALETEESSTTLLDGMTRLQRHLQALGRYGTTAFLVPMYGSGELSQAFCRSAAVFGATYLLRRAPLGVVLSSSQDIVTGMVLQGDSVSEMDESSEKNDTKEKQIKCSQIILPAESMTSSFVSSSPFGIAYKSKRIVRRISVLRGNFIVQQSLSKEKGSTEMEQRHMIIIPPNNPVIGNPYAIHGMVLDHSACVAPVGCTLLHLTTTVADERTNDENYSSILQKACDYLLTLDQTGPVDEIFHFCFSHESFAPTRHTGSMERNVVATTDVTNSTSDKSNQYLPKGLYVCHHNGQELTVDIAFEQAQQIFSQICPGKQFLGLSKELQTILNERALERGDDDEERFMLDSAVGMIDNRPNSSQMTAEQRTGEE